MKKRLYKILGSLCVVLATIGIVLPGLPTTPLLLAASWFFYRSSPRLQRWLLDSSLGVYIRDYERRGGMRRRTKWMVVALMTTVVSCSIILFIPNPIADWIVGTAGLIGCLVVIFKVPNAKED
jgi:uncharacterized membrane protein YbaN (DUF454 family)